MLIVSEIETANINSTHLATLHSLMTKNNDKKNATKVREIYEKLEKNELNISFAGHFSAGKSSMINALLGQSILPQSPIPTSANLVKIYLGDGFARVYFRASNPIEFKEPYDIDLIKSYCKDKEAIEKIEIATSKHILPDGTALMDTPGIDAADDADRLITESSLHLVDVLFYVMDYNHVQSEVNLQFLKGLQDKEIPFFVIVNQIDKHEEHELSFTDFENSIKQTFDQWKIAPNAIYYSSLLDENVEHNQFHSIKEKLNAMLTHEKEAYFSIERSLNQVIADHKRFLKETYEEKMGSLPESGITGNSMLTMQALDQKIQTIKNAPSDFEKAFQAELATTLKNAYLMPAELRGKAEKFLESQENGFKVGLIAAKKKTEIEQKQRLADFLQELTKTIETTIQWKLRDKFASLLKQNQISDSGLLQQTQQISIDFSENDLISLIKPGATANGNYVLNYTNDASSAIKNKFKTEARQLLNSVMYFFDKMNREKLVPLENELLQLQEAVEVKEQMDQIEGELDQQISTVDRQLSDPKPDEEDWKLLQMALDKSYQSIELQEPFQLAEKETRKAKQPTQVKETSATSKQSVQATIEILDQTVQAIEALPSLQSIQYDLEVKQERLSNRTYTIALFGAFSSGKSSFANALIGENILPVSPNPTTAVINRIAPPTDIFQHGTAVVHFKNSETLVDDLKFLTKNLSIDTNSFSKLLALLKSREMDQESGLDNMHQAYIHALISGYADAEDFIGKEITITMEAFSAYVTEEQKACYVESIDLYYDCAVTKQGITLVDTPGADSVNARHTNVSFEYIKYADALLYVTYFNHALSRADKDFLMQLGRVKDAFQLDKMFFIVNAADLAKDDKELKLVTEYIQEQLLFLGIRFPRLFSVSSKRSLTEKSRNKSLNLRMRQFEDAFYHFIHDELSSLSIQAALLDVKRAYQSVSNILASATMDEQEKEDYRINMLAEKEKIMQEINHTETGIHGEEIKQKIEKQIFYVLERLAIRYHDMFKDIFNPTTITESGKNGQKQLGVCMAHLLDYIGYELLQELRAVSLRIERMLQEQAARSYQALCEKIIKIDERIVFPDLATFDLTTPDYDMPFAEMDTRIFQKAMASFKGTKAFFANNEKETMKEAIYDMLQPYAKSYLDNSQDSMEQAYLEQWEQVTDTIKNETHQKASDYIDNSLAVLSDTVDLELLKEKQEIIAAILEKTL